MAGLVDTLGANDDLPSLAAGLVILQLGRHRLVSCAHDIAHTRFTVSNLLALAHVDVPHLEAELLLLFKRVIELEGLLEVGVQIVVNLLRLPVLDPLSPSLVPSAHVDDWVTLREHVQILQLAARDEELNF